MAPVSRSTMNRGRGGSNTHFMIQLAGGLLVILAIIKFTLQPNATYDKVGAVDTVLQNNNNDAGKITNNTGGSSTSQSGQQQQQFQNPPVNNIAVAPNNNNNNNNIPQQQQKITANNNNNNQQRSGGVAAVAAAAAAAPQQKEKKSAPLLKMEFTEEELKDRPTYMFHHYLKAKSGAVIQDMLLVHAHAFQEHAHYGGSCGEPSTKIPAHRKLLESIGLDEILVFACPGDYQDNPLARKVMIPRTSYREADSSLWTPSYISFIQSLVRYPPKVPDQFTISVHVRRGDVSPCRVKNKGFHRYLPNDHYMRLIDKYMQPGARVVIFSQENSYEPFDEFKSKGYELQLDGELTDVWQTIVVSDVVILSRSSFSLVPAVLTKGKVVYTPFWHQPVSGWDIVDEAFMAQSEKVFHQIQDSCPNIDKIKDHD